MVYVNGNCSNLSNFNNFKLFADDTPLFSAVNDASETFENLTNICLLSVNELINGKCLLTQTYPNKLKNSFLRKTTNQLDSVLIFRTSLIIKTSHLKHLGLILDAIPKL